MVRTNYEKPDSGRTGKISSNLGFCRGRWLFSQDFLDLGFGIWEVSLQNRSNAMKGILDKQKGSFDECPSQLTSKFF